MSVGRKKKPTNLKLLQGTFRKDRANPNEPKPKTCIPDPSDYLSDEAREEWERITTELDALGLISAIDRAALEIYCQAYGRLVRYEKIVAEKGELYKTPNGCVQVSPAMQIVNKAAEQLRKILVEFGMTPASRSRVSAKDGKDDAKDPWAKFG